MRNNTETKQMDILKRKNSFSIIAILICTIMAAAIVPGGPFVERSYAGGCSGGCGECFLDPEGTNGSPSNENKPPCSVTSDGDPPKTSGGIPVPPEGKKCAAYCVIDYLGIEPGSTSNSFAYYSEITEVDDGAILMDHDTGCVETINWGKQGESDYYYSKEVPHAYPGEIRDIDPPDGKLFSKPLSYDNTGRPTIEFSYPWQYHSLASTADGSGWRYSVSSSVHNDWPGEETGKVYQYVMGDINETRRYNHYALTDVEVPTLGHVDLSWRDPSTGDFNHDGDTNKPYIISDDNWKYTFTYNATTGAISEILLEEKDTTWVNYSKTSFSETNGTTGTRYYEHNGTSWVEVNNGGGIGRVYTRNYSDTHPDSPGKLQYYIEPADALRMKAEQGSWPDGIDPASQGFDELFAKYSTEYKYDSNGKVSRVTSGQCCGGTGAQVTTFAYGSADGTGYNDWATSREDDERPVTSEAPLTRGDGKVIRYYMNSLGRVVHKFEKLYVSRSVAQTRHWHYDYDAEGYLENEYGPEVLNSSTITVGGSTGDDIHDDGTITFDTGDINTDTGIINLTYNTIPTALETGDGLSGEYTDNSSHRNFRIDETINQTPSSSNLPDSVTTTGLDITWKGKIETPSAIHSYTFYITGSVGTSLEVNGNTATITTGNSTSLTLDLSTGTKYDIEVEHSGTDAVKLEWESDDAGITKAVIPSDNLFSPSRTYWHGDGLLGDYSDSASNEASRTDSTIHFDFGGSDTPPRLLQPPAWRLHGQERSRL